ncbi:MAG: hypothetical protein ABI543_01945 [Ignavibacteria bacterium]
MSEDTKETQEIPVYEKATKLEIIITVLLGVTTVLGAFAAYCSALWGGEMQSSYSLSIAKTNNANTIYLEALNDLTSYEMNDMKDDIIYSQWKENSEKGDVEDAQYFFSKLSEGYQKDLKDDPKDVSEYEKEQQSNLDSIKQSFHDSELMSDTAEVLMQKGNIANKQGDGFTLCTVLFTVVLFFLGLASLKTHSTMQKTYVILAVVILVLSLARMVMIPFPF